jgi:hypothetical protein
VLTKLTGFGGNYIFDVEVMRRGQKGKEKTTNSNVRKLELSNS